MVDFMPNESAIVELIKTSELTLSKFYNLDKWELLPDYDISKYTTGEYQTFLLNWINVPIFEYERNSRVDLRDLKKSLKSCNKANWNLLLRSVRDKEDTSMSFRVIKNFALHSFLLYTLTGESTEAMILRSVSQSEIDLRFGLTAAFSKDGFFSLVSGTLK